MEKHGYGFIKQITKQPKEEKAEGYLADDYSVTGSIDELNADDLFADDDLSGSGDGTWYNMSAGRRRRKKRRMDRYHKSKRYKRKHKNDAPAPDDQGGTPDGGAPAPDGGAPAPDGGAPGGGAPPAPDGGAPGGGAPPEPEGGQPMSQGGAPPEPPDPGQQGGSPPEPPSMPDNEPQAPGEEPQGSGESEEAAGKWSADGNIKVFLGLQPKHWLWTGLGLTGLFLLAKGGVFQKAK